MVLSFWDGPIANRDVVYNLTVAGAPLTAMSLSSPITTDGLKVKGFRVLGINVDYVHSAATTVTCALQVSEDNVTWRGLEVSQAGSFPTFTTGDLILSRAVSASGSWQWQLPSGVFLIADYVRFVLSGASAGAGDTVTVSAHPGIQ